MTEARQEAPSNADLQEVAPQQRRGVAAFQNAEAERATEEVRASMQLAKMFPRDINDAYTRIMQACRRETLAEQAVYVYKRGSTIVEGPSVRLAEALAQNWGNMVFGIRELSRETGASNVEAFAWDLETNTRQIKTFRVAHVRDTKSGAKRLTEERDIYEMVANQGARRMRACILGVIPGDIVDAAVDECRKTLSGKHTKPLADRIREMADAFRSNFAVSVEMLEQFLGHKLEASTEAEVVRLRGVYRSLKDGIADRSEFFDLGGSGEEEGKPRSTALKDGLKAQAKGQQPEPASAPEKSPEPAQEAAPEESTTEPEAQQQAPAESAEQSLPLDDGDTATDPYGPLYPPGQHELPAEVTAYIQTGPVAAAYGKLCEALPELVNDENKLANIKRRNLTQWQKSADQMGDPTRTALDILVNFFDERARQGGYPQE